MYWENKEKHFIQYSNEVATNLVTWQSWKPPYSFLLKMFWYQICCSCFLGYRNLLCIPRWHLFIYLFAPSHTYIVIIYLTWQDCQPWKGAQPQRWSLMSSGERLKVDAEWSSTRVGEDDPGATHPLLSITISSGPQGILIQMGYLGFWDCSLFL